MRLIDRINRERKIFEHSLANFTLNESNKIRCSKCNRVISFSRGFYSKGAYFSVSLNNKNYCGRCHYELICIQDTNDYSILYRENNLEICVSGERTSTALFNLFEKRYFKNKYYDFFIGI
jgi:hypothetical protein